MFKKLLFSVGISSVCLVNSFAKEKNERDGKTVYEESCAVCHSTDHFLKEAPVYGDKKAWAEFIKEGQQFPVAHGWLGTRKMPKKGGDPDITLNEFINAVAYLGNSAGADWKEAKKLDKKVYDEILKEIEIRMLRNMVYDNIGKNY